MSDCAVAFYVLFHIVIKTTLWDSYYHYPHFTGKKKEVQRSNFLKVIHWKIVEPGSGPQRIYFKDLVTIRLFCFSPLLPLKRTILSCSNFSEELVRDTTYGEHIFKKIFYDCTC